MTFYQSHQNLSFVRTEVMECIAYCCTCIDIDISINLCIDICISINYAGIVCQITIYIMYIHTQSRGRLSPKTIHAIIV